MPEEVTLRSDVEAYCERNGCDEMEAANDLGLNLDEMYDVNETDED